MLQETIELLRLSLRQLCEIALAVIAMGAFGVFLLRRVVPWLRSWNARMSILLASCAIAAYYGGGKNDGGEQSPDAPSNMLMAPFGAVMDAVPSGAMDAPGIRSITKDSYGVEMEFHRPGSGSGEFIVADKSIPLLGCEARD